MSGKRSGDGPPRESRSDRESGGFADLIGETRPAKGSDKKRVTPHSGNASAARRAGKPGHLAGTGARDSQRGNPETSRNEPFRHPDPSEARLAARRSVSDLQLRELARGEPAPAERIDLHGVRVDGGPRLLAGRLASARERGLRSVVVIHGRGKNSETGEAVLRDALPRWLQSAPAANHVLGFAPAPPALGGEGATLVLLRRRN